MKRGLTNQPTDGPTKRGEKSRSTQLKRAKKIATFKFSLHIFCIPFDLLLIFEFDGLLSPFSFIHLWQTSGVRAVHLNTDDEVPCSFIGGQILLRRPGLRPKIGYSAKYSAIIWP